MLIPAQQALPSPSTFVSEARWLQDGSWVTFQESEPVHNSSATWAEVAEPAEG